MMYNNQPLQRELKKGEIWLYKDRDCVTYHNSYLFNAKDEYDDRKSYKIRPCIIIAPETGRADEKDVTIIKLTAQETDDINDFLIEDWEEIGLKNKSYARCSKIMTVNKEDILHKVTTIPRAEYKRIEISIFQYITQSFI